MREQTAGVENTGVSPMDSQLRISLDSVKLIQICYLTYEIHIIRQYNIGVTLYAFSFLVRLIWHTCRLVLFICITIFYGECIVNKILLFYGIRDPRQ